MSENNDGTIGLVVDIVSAYVSNNRVPAAEMASLIATTHAALAGLGNAPAEAAPAEKQAPAISVKKSVTPEYLICLEDGKKFKSLKRHLRTAFGLTPGQYRSKWGLPSDYPMVAPAYAAARSNLAKSMGFGQQVRKTAPAKPRDDAA